MSNLSLDFDSFGSIRRTEDGKISVYDLISVVSGQKSPREVWRRLTEQYPEVVTKCDNLKFKGAGQRNTPVTDKEGALYILGILPGAVGRKYREEAAKLVLKYLENPTELALEIIDNTKNVKDAQDLATRAQSVATRLTLTGALSDRKITNIGYGRVTNAGYKAIFGTDANGLRKEAGTKGNLRDTFSQVDLITSMLGEALTIEALEKNPDVKGDKAVADLTFKTCKPLSAFVRSRKVEDVPVFDFTKE